MFLSFPSPYWRKIKANPPGFSVPNHFRTKRQPRSVFLLIWGGHSEVARAGMKSLAIKKLRSRTLIQVPIWFQGTEHFQNDGILTFENGELRAIDTSTYPKDLASKLPAGLAMNDQLRQCAMRGVK